MGIVTNSLKVAGLFVGKRKYRIVIVVAQLAYMGAKHIIARNKKKKQRKYKMR